jgi:hypothetical protein
MLIDIQNEFFKTVLRDVCFISGICRRTTPLCIAQAIIVPRITLQFLRTFSVLMPAKSMKKYVKLIVRYSKYEYLNTYNIILIVDKGVRDNRMLEKWNIRVIYVSIRTKCIK